jgi:hypothetical protein
VGTDGLVGAGDAIAVDESGEIASNFVAHPAIIMGFELFPQDCR